jgi:hypothetical protein
MPRIILRFADLKRRKIINNWPTLLRWIEREGFPAGFYLGPNSRAWFEDEIDAWLDERARLAASRQEAAA